MPFRLKLSLAFYEQYHIEHQMTIAYHQQANELAEQANKMVMIKVNQHMLQLEIDELPDLL